MNSDFRDYVGKRDEREKLMHSAMDRALVIIGEQRNRIASLEAQLAEQPAGVLIPQADYDELMRRESEAIQALTQYLQSL